MGAKALRRVLVMAALAVLPGCAVRTVDCWQLDDTELADARGRGQCGDAFARNMQQIVPIGDAAKAVRKKPKGTATVERPQEQPPLPAKAQRKRTAKPPTQVGSTASPESTRQAPSS